MTTSPATAPPAPISPDDVRVLMEMAASLRLSSAYLRIAAHYHGAIYIHVRDDLPEDHRFSLRLGNDPASATIGYGPDLPAALTAAMLPTRPAPDVATTTS